MQRSSNADLVHDLRRRRLAEQLHHLGPRPLLEILIEVAGGADLDTTLERYAAINPEILRAVGGDQFPPSIWRAS
jgi:hypothetical protein